MDFLLLAVAAISLLAAGGFGAFAWRLLAEQRQRSAARVAALASTLDPTAPGAADRPQDGPVPVAVSSMFETAPGASVRGRPLIKAAVVATMAVLLIVVVAMANRDHTEVAAPAAEEPAPLELVSMRHNRDGSTLTVTGLVRNPRAGAPKAGIVAVVFAFDRDGGFVTSARAPLDFTTLAPGDESPFVVNLPHKGDVGRYRVSFRTEAGVLRHVDRRAMPAAGAVRASAN
jgi:hypothetical protein